MQNPQYPSSPLSAYQPTSSNRGQNKINSNPESILPYNKTDAQFFNDLEFYKPICYSGKGSPIFLVNKNWYLSLGCILVMNAIFLLVLFFFLRNSDEGYRPMSTENVRKYTIINIVSMTLITITYFFTQFLNPGIRNLSRISQEQYVKDGKFYCYHCNGNRTQNMQHCRDCQVCIEGLDHHCGFFSKCIGGCQKYFFFAFLCFTFIGFLGLIVTLTASIGL